MARDHFDVADHEWVAFPGGELEGPPTEVMCARCRKSRESREARGRTLCFQCYRADLDRARSFRAAGNLNTASEARFQSQLPFEPVDRPRLQMLKVQRSRARVPGQFVDRRRRAQIAARHALQAISIDFSPLKACRVKSSERAAAIAAAIHAAELQLPESWLPFVVAR